MNETLDNTAENIAETNDDIKDMGSNISSIASGHQTPMANMPLPSLKEKYNMDKLTELLQATFSAIPDGNGNGSRSASGAGFSRADGADGADGAGYDDGGYDDGGYDAATLSGMSHAKRILTQLLKSLEAQGTHPTPYNEDHGGHLHSQPTAMPVHDADAGHDHGADAGHGASGGHGADAGHGHNHGGDADRFHEGFVSDHNHHHHHHHSPSAPVVKVHRADGSKLPVYGSCEAAGADLSALNGGSIAPSERRLISTGLRMDIPKGYEIQIRPRSGLALKHGITMLNSPGTIDSDYKGEIGLIVINHSDTYFHYEQGDRLAQAVVAPVLRGLFVDAPTGDPLSSSERGSGGFGSTGLQ